MGFGVPSSDLLPLLFYSVWCAGRSVPIIQYREDIPFLKEIKAFFQGCHYKSTIVFRDLKFRRVAPAIDNFVIAQNFGHSSYILSFL